MGALLPLDSVSLENDGCYVVGKAQSATPMIKPLEQASGLKDHDTHSNHATQISPFPM